MNRLPSLNMVKLSSRRSFLKIAITREFITRFLSFVRAIDPCAKHERETRNELAQEYQLHKNE